MSIDTISIQEPAGDRVRGRTRDAWLAACCRRRRSKLRYMRRHSCSGPWVLVRPDGYVAAVISTGPVLKLDHYLAKVGVTENERAVRMGNGG
jgi:hypothetical protein